MRLIRKVIGLTIVGLLAIGMVSTGVLAYFTDTETSPDSLNAGTLDLRTNNANGVTQTLYAAALKPNSTVGPSTITLKNTGTVVGATLDISFAYAESDGSPNTVNKSADSTAAVIEVTTLTYNGSSLLGSVIDGNGNGYKDLQDAKNASLIGQTGLGAGASKDFVVTAKMRDGISNDFQGDGITVTMTFVLNQ